MDVFRSEDVAREEAERENAEFLERLQAAGDVQARELEATLKLPAGVHVVFELEERPLERLVEWRYRMTPSTRWRASTAGEQTS